MLSIRNYLLHSFQGSVKNTVPEMMNGSWFESRSALIPFKLQILGHYNSPLLSSNLNKSETILLVALKKTTKKKNKKKLPDEWQTV